jgi:hypothetical protein
MKAGPAHHPCGAIGRTAFAGLPALPATFPHMSCADCSLCSRGREKTQRPLLNELVRRSRTRVSGRKGADTEHEIAKNRPASSRTSARKRLATRTRPFARRDHPRSPKIQGGASTKERSPGCRCCLAVHGDTTTVGLSQKAGRAEHSQGNRSPGHSIRNTLAQNAIGPDTPDRKSGPTGYLRARGNGLKASTQHRDGCSVDLGTGVSVKPPLAD